MCTCVVVFVILLFQIIYVLQKCFFSGHAHYCNCMIEWLWKSSINFTDTATHTSKSKSVSITTLARSSLHAIKGYCVKAICHSVVNSTVVNFYHNGWFWQWLQCYWWTPMHVYTVNQVMWTGLKKKSYVPCVSVYSIHHYHSIVFTRIAKSASNLFSDRPLTKPL